MGTSLVVHCLRLCAPNGGGWSLIPGLGSRSHILQLQMPRGTTKTLCNQINKIFFKNTLIHITLYIIYIIHWRVDWPLTEPVNWSLTEEGADWGKIRSSLLDLWLERSIRLPREASRRLAVRQLKVQGSPSRPQREIWDWVRSPGKPRQGKSPKWPWEIRQDQPRRQIRSGHRGHTRGTPGGHPEEAASEAVVQWVLLLEG